MTPEFTLAHIGINPGGGDAGAIASLFQTVFGLPVKEGRSSVFAGSLVEVMRTDYLGKKGHIALATPSIEDAAQWLKARGAELDTSTEKRDEKGNITAVYVKGDFGGFAVHLLRR